MQFCLTLLFLAFLPAIGFASDAVWNCNQDKTTKEWVCIGEKGPENADIDTQIPPATPETTVSSVPKKSASSESVPLLDPEIKQVATEEPKQKVKKPILVKPTVRETIAKNAGARADDTRNSGWHCKPGESGQDWNCNLTGPDPKGEAHIVSNDKSGFSLLDPAFDPEQEKIFSALVTHLKYDPWANCSIDSSAVPSGFTPKGHLRDVSALDVNADYGEVFDNEISSYKGNVDIKRADQHSLSHTAQYDTVSQSLDLQGDVYYSEDNLALYSNSANLKLATDQATLRNVQFINPSGPLRGRASTVYRESQAFSRYKDVAYTSCPPSNTDWVMHASELKMNDTTGKGSAKNPWLEFKGVPVFYSPYLSFPIDSRRLSGFLAPSYGRTQRSGFHFSVPYYWNIAPNYDATITPRYLFKRGPMVISNFRFLTEFLKGNVGLEYMPNDDLLNKSRFLGTIKNTSYFGPYVYSNLDLNYVSDKDFFNDLGNALTFTNASFVRSSADIGFHRQGVSLAGRIENYQTIDQSLPTSIRPYKKLPQIQLDLDHSFKFFPLNANLQSEFVDFVHDGLVNGQRFNIKPTVTSPLQTDWGFVKPKVALQFSDYQLTDQTPGNPNSITRTLPIFSLDSGLNFEKELFSSTSPFKQTLEPRLFYLYIPKTDQKSIPIFDTSVYDLWFETLFRDNRFSGTDRVQDANQVTAALTTKLVDPITGRERLKFNIGEIFYFQDREVTLPVRVKNLPGYVAGRPDFPVQGLESPPETDFLSPLIAEISGQFSDHWSGDSGIQWSPQSNEIVRGRAALHYIDEGQKIFNIGFHYRRDQLLRQTLLYNANFLETRIPGTNQIYNPINDQAVVNANDIIQSEVSFRWPLFDNWAAIGRMQYSWLYNNTQDSFLGLEKENCCWRFRIIGRRYINGSNTLVNTDFNSQIAQGRSQTGIFFQLELKGLSNFGEKLDRFFERNIFGYQSPEN